MVDYEARMTFTEHLAELRMRLIRSLFALGVGVILCYVVSDQLIVLLASPLAPLGETGIISSAPSETPADAAKPEGASPSPPDTAPAQSAPVRQVEWTVLNPLEFVIVKFKVAGYGGFLFALPFVIWQFCAFVFPGLLPHEKRVMKILIFGCSILAVAGVSVAYFGVFPLVLPYLLEWTLPFIKTQLRLNETLDIIIKLMAAFAVAFQFPMAVLILVYMDLLTPQKLREFRKFAIVGMAVASAALTPPDVFSMAIMLTPLLLFYEASIILSYLVVRRRKQMNSSGAG